MMCFTLCLKRVIKVCNSFCWEEIVKMKHLVGSSEGIFNIRKQESVLCCLALVNTFYLNVVVNENNGWI